MHSTHLEPIAKNIGVLFLALILVTHLSRTSSAQHHGPAYNVSFIKFKVMSAPSVIQQPRNLKCALSKGPLLTACSIQCATSSTDCCLFYVNQNRCLLCSIMPEMKIYEPLSIPAFILDKRFLLGKLILGFQTIHTCVQTRTTVIFLSTTMDFKSSIKMLKPKIYVCNEYCPYQLFITSISHINMG